MVKRKKEKRKAVLIRLPEFLAREVEKLAIKEDRSLTKIVERLLEQQLKGQQNE